MSETPREIRSWRIVTLLELLDGFAANFVGAAGTLGQAIVRLQEDDIPHPTTITHIGNALSDLRKLGRYLNLRSVNQQCERIEDYFKSGVGIRRDRLRELITDLLHRVTDDLRDRTFLVLPAESADLYRQTSNPFGPEVSDKFPRANEDIGEAAKCLALNRSTAAVFHLMRAMECAVLKLGNKLGVTVIDKNNVELEWGPVLANMKAPIEAMPRGKDRDRWSQSHSLLYHVKQAWRNDTMHPKQTYTTEEARAIFDAVKTFMRDLSAMV